MAKLNNIDAVELCKGKLVVKIKVKKMNQATWRLWVAGKLLVLAARVIPGSIEAEVVDA